MTGGPRIAVLDYGIGNLRSAEKALQHVGAAARLVTDAAAVEAADAVVLPGVGAFGACARALRDSGLEEPARAALDAGVPFFGVCVGFQLLYEGSVESPGAAGLGVLAGTVGPLPTGVKHPQMQWNTLEVLGDGEPAPLRGLGPDPWVYFVHSFAPPVGPETVAVCDYGGPVAALVSRGPLWGAQFHPEKSGATGLALLANFVGLAVAAWSMELLPAIDLRHGEAVRLTQGDFDRQQGYGDPAALATRYIEGGARWIHVVDLDAARTGVEHERAALREIVRLATASSVSVQAGGGIRTDDIAEELLEVVGVARVVLGTAALEDPPLAGRLARHWPGRVAVGLDYRVGPDGVAEALAQGWLAGSGHAVTDLLEEWAGEPFGAVVVTEVARDGTLEGPAVEALAALLLRTELPLVASGGVGTTGDLWRLAHLQAGGRRLAGAIVGKALVERRFSVEEALAACAASD